MAVLPTAVYPVSQKWVTDPHLMHDNIYPENNTVRQLKDKPKLSWREMLNLSERLAQGMLIDEWVVKVKTVRPILLRVWM